MFAFCVMMILFKKLGITFIVVSSFILLGGNAFSGPEEEVSLKGFVGNFVKAECEPDEAKAPDELDVTLADDATSESTPA